MCSFKLQMHQNPFSAVDDVAVLKVMLGFPYFDGPAFSSPAFSTPVIWSRVFQSRDFQSRVFSVPHVVCLSVRL